MVEEVRDNGPDAFPGPRRRDGQRVAWAVVPEERSNRRPASPPLFASEDEATGALAEVSAVPPRGGPVTPRRPEGRRSGKRGHEPEREEPAERSGKDGGLHVGRIAARIPGRLGGPADASGGFVDRAGPSRDGSDRAEGEHGRPRPPSCESEPDGDEDGDPQPRPHGHENPALGGPERRAEGGVEPGAPRERGGGVEGRHDGGDGREREEPEGRAVRRAGDGQRAAVARHGYRPLADGPLTGGRGNRPTSARSRYGAAKARSRARNT